MSGMLLTCLHEHANVGGLVMAREEILLELLGVTRDALVGELRALEEEGAIRILSPLPFLALKLKKWSGRAAQSANSGPSAYSYSHSQPKQLNEGLPTFVWLKTLS